MEFEEVTLETVLVKSENGLISENDEDSNASQDIFTFCQTCLATSANSNLKDMTKRHSYGTRYEVYSDMLEYCFGLKFGKDRNTERVENVYLICEDCIEKLRYVLNFKTQVEKSQQNIKRRIGNSHHSEYFPAEMPETPIRSLRTHESQEDQENLSINRESGNEDSSEDSESLSDDDSNEDDRESGDSYSPFDHLMSSASELPKFSPASYRILQVTLDEELESIDKEIMSLLDENGTDSSSSDESSTGRPPSVDNDDEPVQASLPSYRRLTTNTSQPRRPNVGMTMSTSRKPNVVLTREILALRAQRNRRRDVSYRELPYTLESDQVQCEICSTVFDTNTNLQAHMPIHFPNFTCDICGNVFANGYQFDSHMQVHTKEKNECPTCKKVFKTSGYMRVHMKIKHGSKPYECNKCQHCGERFNSFYRKQRHIHTAHGISAKEYKCRLCDKVLSSSGLRAQHMRRFHIAERKHVCSICYVSFCERSYLADHMLTHTGIRKFPCSVCKKKFLRSYTLKEHMKIHTGEKRHVCPICHRAFTQKCSLKGHMAVHR